jgi:adenylate kinase family enzyme
MRQENPQRIAIIGLPGSGKSTFAIKLGKALNIPVHHLDRHMFDGREKREKSEFLAIKEPLLKEEAWIIEGCSFSTLEMRFARADTVIYLDFPRMLCIWRVCKRLFTFDKHLNETGCLDGINWTLIKYIWNFNGDKRQGIEELSRRYPEVEFLVFHHSRDLNKYLENVKGNYYHEN